MRLSILGPIILVGNNIHKMAKKTKFNITRSSASKNKIFEKRQPTLNKKMIKTVTLQLL